MKKEIRILVSKVITIVPRFGNLVLMAALAFSLGFNYGQKRPPTKSTYYQIQVGVLFHLLGLKNTMHSIFLTIATFAHRNFW